MTFAVVVSLALLSSTFAGAFLRQNKLPHVPLGFPKAAGALETYTHEACMLVLQHVAAWAWPELGLLQCAETLRRRAECDIHESCLSQGMMRMLNIARADATNQESSHS